jgi:pyruvate ferredoxin oxidoreductase beta subunit
MSKERIKISEDLYDIMPSDYQDLVKSATYGKEDRGWKDIGNSKELIEQHSLCAGCPESMAFRYILASLPNPEDTVMVGSTGCTSLVFPMVAVHNIHSLFGNQNAIASGLKRALSVRFPGRTKDVVVLAGDGATVDIGLDMTLQAWFRQEKFTTICFDNELYANTGGQESGLMQKGFVAKMAPVGKLFDKVRLPEIARESGCHYAKSVRPTSSSIRLAFSKSERTAWKGSRKCGTLKNRPSGSPTKSTSASLPSNSSQRSPPKIRKRRPLQNSSPLREPNPILEERRS